MTIQRLISLLNRIPDNTIEVLIQETSTGYHLHEILEVIGTVDEITDKPVIIIRYREDQ